MKQTLIFLCLWLGLFQAVHSQTKTFDNTIIVATSNELYQALKYANQIGGNTDIVLNDGHYQIHQRLTFLSPNIRVRSKSGKPSSVILSGTGMKKHQGLPEVLMDISSHNISISSLTLERSANHLIQVRGEKGANHFFLSDCVLRDSFEQLLKVTASTQEDGPYTDGGIINNCLFEYTAGIGPQYYIGGIDAHRAINWLVSHNIFRNIASPSTRVAEHAIHFWRESKNITVANNIIENCDRGIGFGLGPQATNQTIGGLIEKNVISNNNPRHKFTDVAIGIEASPNIRVLNNIVLSQNAYPNAIEYRFKATKNVVIRDNFTNKSIVSRDGGSADLFGNKQANLLERLQNTLQGYMQRL